MFFLSTLPSFGSYLYEGEDTANLTLEVVEAIKFEAASMVLDFGIHTSSGNTEVLESNELTINITGSYNNGNSLNVYFDNDLLKKTITLTNKDESDSISTTIKMDVISNLDNSNLAEISLVGEIGIGETLGKTSGDYSGTVVLYAEYN